MSDFLSNFTNNNYDGEKKGKQSAKSKKKPEKGTPAASSFDEEVAASFKPETVPEEPQKTSMVSQPASAELTRREAAAQASEVNETPPNEPEKKTRTSRFQEEETEFDPGFKKKQQRKYAVIAALVIAALAACFGIYYQMTHVKVPDFVGKELTEARAWSTEEGVKLDVKQEYDFDTPVNNITQQGVKASKKIKKGKTLTLTASLGPDPEELLSLPDFKELAVEAARTWIEEHKAENVSVIEEYNDETEKGSFMKSEFSDKEITVDTYRRKDKLKLYYSKGTEPREETIEVLSFVGKPKAEVEEWAKKNEVKLEAEEVFSDSIETGQVISQETAKGKKIAKKDVFKVKVSIGKAKEVPDYSQYTIEEANTLEGGIPAQIKSVYASEVPYGQFISQSVEPGTQYKETDSLPTVKVYYSAGRPYMKDLRGSTSEGDLQQIFFDEYRSKGAAVTYEVYYVDSSEAKGTVVEMSEYAQFISLEAHIYIGISKGNLTPAAEPDAGTGADTGSDEPTSDTAE